MKRIDGIYKKPSRPPLYITYTPSTSVVAYNYWGAIPVIAKEQT